jgi:Leucine-rich repeat (LRR) protein
MVKLKSLNLSNNQLKNIPNLSPCVRLSKLYISFNHIQELPEYLGQMEMEEFKFEGCPIKRIHCVDWLKELLDDNSAILQKYLYWYEKIPAADHTTHSSKCAARLLTPEDENEYSSEDESETDKEGLSFLMDPAC